MPANQDPIPEITRFCLAIQREWSPRERLRRLRCDEKPVVACADNRHVEVSADDWVAHHERHGGMEGQGGGRRVLFNEHDWTFQVDAWHEYNEQAQTSTLKKERHSSEDNQHQNNQERLAWNRDPCGIRTNMQAE